MSKSVKTAEKNNQLTNPLNYDVNKMIFSEPVKGSVPDTPIQFKRINISTLNSDGSVGDLILPTERLFSFGVSVNTNPETKQPNGHTLPLCLHNRDGPTQAEQAWVETFNNIVEHCKQYLVDNREEIEQYDLSMNDLKKFNCLYYKREKGKIVEGSGPTLYAKLIESKGKAKKGQKKTENETKIMSMFFDTKGEPLDPMNLMGKYCWVKAAVKIESIFVGSKITFQVKLYEAEIELTQTGMKPLMSRPKAKQGGLLSGNSNNMNDMKIELDDDDDGPGSVKNSDDEDDHKSKVKSKPKTPVKKEESKVKTKKEEPEVEDEPKPVVRNVIKKISSKKTT
jgi:Protein of unknown function (DUF2738)